MSDQRKGLPPTNSANFLEKVREAISVYMGNRGDLLDRGVTLRDLQESGMVELRPGYKVGGGKANSPILGAGSAITDAYALDLTPPPTPTNFVANAGISNLTIECDAPTYTAGHGHAKGILYGATWVLGNGLPVFATATKINEFTGSVASHATNPATTWHLWLKWVTKDGVESISPAGGTNGVVVTTGQDVSLLLNALEGKIKSEQLYADLGARIDLVDVGTSSLVSKVGGLLATYGSTASAATSAAAAAQSAADAATAKANAILAQGGASNSATTASTKATEAATSATNAVGSASTAATSASAAATSATTATQKAAAAATSATSAATSATASETSSTASTAAKVAAVSAQTAAQGSATAASTSASTATTKATEASTSAASAATSATTASTKAGDASTYASNAANSATSSAGSANTATTQAGLASTANNAAGTSAAAALVSQNASAISATSAAGSESSAASTLTNINAVVAGAASAAVSTESQARITADKQLFAQYTVKVDVNGYVSGYGLASTLVGDVPTSAFAVRTDRFYVASPAGPGVAPTMPFYVQTAPTMVNGVSVPVGVYKRSTLKKIPKSKKLFFIKLQYGIQYFRNSKCQKKQH